MIFKTLRKIILIYRYKHIYKLRDCNLDLTNVMKSKYPLCVDLHIFGCIYICVIYYPHMINLNLIVLVQMKEIEHQGFKWKNGKKLNN